MHAVLLTLLVIAAADQPAKTPTNNTNAAAAIQPEAITVEDDCPECVGEVDCYGAAGRPQRLHPLTSWFWDVLGPMPQTCYGPRFGCYPGSSRTIHRYPAFHGYYYRHPYNYRHLFDYPWHAAPHEPVGFFAYQRQAMEQGDDCPFQEELPAEAGQPQPAPTKAAVGGQSRRPSSLQAPRTLLR